MLTLMTHPFCCILPPHIVAKLAESKKPAVRAAALETMRLSAAALERRLVFTTMPQMAAIPAVGGKKARQVFDMKGRTRPLPGSLARAEGKKAGRDVAVNEAYDYSGLTHDFYLKVFKRNSLDARGMTLISSVHYGRQYDNAFWNGEQMVYGDGDGQLFVRFTKSRDVVGHELTHGVVSNTCNLEYEDEPGALNEHLADTFGVMMKQWSLGHDVKKADWLIGAEIMVPRKTVKALRTFKNELAYEKDPFLGTDPQPKHMKNKYTGDEDNGGVHINSGIPNHAFYLVATALGGNSWEKAGAIWYRTMLALTIDSQFADMVKTTSMIAGKLYGAASLEQQAVDAAWKQVGL